MVIDPLLVDIYKGDLHGKPNIKALVAAGPPWHGLILKATQGDYYPGPDALPDHRPWFLEYWRQARELAGERYGVDWWRGLYHFFDFRKDAVKQAHWTLQLLAEAGGTGPGDLWPMIDVESGGGNPERPGAARIEDALCKYTEVIQQELGMRCTLYGNIYLWENGVNFQNTGCYKLVAARYTADFPSEVYERIGATLDDCLGWQYGGTEAGDKMTAYLPRYPHTTPLGNADITAVIAHNGGEAALAFLRNELNPEHMPFSPSSAGES